MITLQVDGFYNLEIKEIQGQLFKEPEENILSKLNSGEYVISMNKKQVFNVSDLNNPLYSFELIPSDNLEYYFDNVN